MEEFYFIALAHHVVEYQIRNFELICNNLFDEIEYDVLEDCKISSKHSALTRAFITVRGKLQETFPDYLFFEFIFSQSCDNFEFKIVSQLARFTANKNASIPDMDKTSLRT